MSNKIIGLEGGAFAGKTTLLNYLRENHPDRVSVVPEASEIVGGDKHFPSVPFADFEAAKFSTHFFLELERERSRIAKDLLKERNLPVILDRSTMISTTLFYFMLEQNHPDFHQFQDSFLDYALEIFAKEFDLESFIVPAFLVYLRPKNQEVFQSRLGRGTKNETMAEWEGFEFLDAAYLSLLARHFDQPGQHIKLESENTQDNLKMLATATLGFAEETIAISRTNLFRNFFAEEVHQPKPLRPEFLRGNFDSARNMLLGLMEKAGTL
jgi:deoxyadenosine/deoxycytidine kinase